MAHYYQNLLRRLGWSDLGRVLAGGVMEIGDIQGKPSLEEAENPGASVV